MDTAKPPRQISPNFDLEELTQTNTGLPNTPDDAAIENLSRLANEILEPIRALLWSPLAVHSGYRCHAVNLAVGGARASAHLEGRACDFHPVGDCLIRSEFQKILESDIPFDRIILEYRGSRYWIHAEISRQGDTPRRKAYLAVANDNDGMNYREIKKC
jgi:hypothetical protein